MTTINDSALKRIESVLNSVGKEIEQVHEMLKSKYPNRTIYDLSNPGLTSRLCSLLLSTIVDLSPKGSAYIETARLVYKTMDFTAVIRLNGILYSLRFDYVNGNLKNLSELIDSDFFSGILDQAEYLNSKRFFRAGAVVAGVALEEHLRKLVVKHEVSLPEGRKYMPAETLNTQLHANKIYDSTLAKSITAWLGLRNDSAHPKKEIEFGLVEPMIEGVRTFISNYPA